MRAPPATAGQPQSPYNMAPQGMMQPPSSPFAAPSWQTQSQQVSILYFNLLLLDIFLSKF
jgi:hypothetical protein